MHRHIYINVCVCVCGCGLPSFSSRVSCLCRGSCPATLRANCPPRDTLIMLKLNDVEGWMLKLNKVEVE
jgi:hypothetical protein